MDKNAIKRYAVWARRELISRVTQRAALFEITEEKITDASADSVRGRVLSSSEKRQRQALIARIRAKDFKQVMEEIAYTWFNRFIALRFMEVNQYLPSHVRVFTDDEGAFRPQILSEAIDLELDGLDKGKVYALKTANDDDALFKYLIIVQCNALSEILPGMFQRIEDYTELLFPDNLLRAGSVIEQMVTSIPEADWTDQVQIIGWLYQYYNTEPKDQVFADLKKNIKITKEKIPAATQLFTPDWIVRYMVENSLGRLWVEGHPAAKEKFLPEHKEDGSVRVEEGRWNYYLEEAEQEPEVQAQLAEIRKGYAAMTPEQLRVIDPCCGSGHILVYLFDVLVQIYEDYGYTAREAASSIIRHNLWGLDIDERAAQLSYFSVMMKARQYDRRFFSRGLQPHVIAIAESNSADREAVDYFCKGDAGLRLAMETILGELRDAKEYGSILTCTKQDWDALYERFGEVYDEISLHRDDALALLPLVRTAEALSQQYDVVVTNPPYMGSSGMSGKLSEFVKKNYPDSKSDLFAVFIERCGQMTGKHGFQAMITQHSWMFLSSFEKLRAKLQVVDIVNMAHLGARAFEEIGGEVVQTTSFVLQRSHIKEYAGNYCRLIEPTTQQGKEELFLAGKNRYTTKQKKFSIIPGAPFAYWVSPKMFGDFIEGVQLRDIATPKQGVATTDNNRFVRFWTEVSFQRIGFGFNSPARAEISGFKWFPFNKGGEYNKWYGNRLYVVNYQNDGKEIKENVLRKYPYLKTPDFVVKNAGYYFRECISWSKISLSNICFRFYEDGFIFSDAGMAMFIDKNKLYPIFGLLNSKVAFEVLQIIAPSTNFESGHMEKIPVLSAVFEQNRIAQIVQDSIQESKEDWDSFETSWDFKRHPLV
jgi:hypothetical protein